MKISLQRLSLNKFNIKKNLPLLHQGREGEDDEKERERGRKEKGRGKGRKGLNFQYLAC